MANRRFGNNQGPPQRGGGGGGGGGLNRSFGPSSNISPWQGGAPPGNPNNNIQNQLALALTSLIQQTQQPPQDGPPSLLSMNTSPGFFNQDQYNNQNRFGNRGRQDFRRSEPYSKNRGGGVWRSESNRPNNRGSNNFSSKKNFRNQRSPGKDNKIKNDRKSEKSPSKQDRTPTDNANADDRVEKDVKSTKEEPTTDASDEKKSTVPKTTKYDGLPNCLLHCFVCNKSMWDGESFQNHIGGKAHKQMISSLEESFQITVNILRENMRLCEERKMIEYERMQRSRRYHHNNQQQEQESHCNMCDLKFMGKIVVHRQTEGHQRLKRFLHPKCKKCNLEFPSRMEWIDHQFIPDHLIKLKETIDGNLLESGEFKLTIQAEMDNEPLLEENAQNEDDNPVLELSHDMTNLFNRIPVYKKERAIAKESMKEAKGFICELCKVFMPSEQESEDHMKSQKHYHLFVEEAKTRFQKAAADKKKKTEEEEAVKKESEGTKDDEDMEKLLDEMYDPFTTDGDADGEGEVEAEGEDDVEGDGEGERPEETADEEPETSASVEAQPEVKEDVEDSGDVEIVEATKEETAEKKPTPVTTPNTRAKRGNVKNGAGPKSKKLRN